MAFVVINLENDKTDEKCFLVFKSKKNVVFISFIIVKIFYLSLKLVKC